MNVEAVKVLLGKGDYRAARGSFADANRHYRKPKVFIVGTLLRLAPGLVRRVMQGR